jgi:hypothetical protein
MNTGYPVPVGLPVIPIVPREFTQGERHLHDGKPCVLWSSCTRMSDDQVAYAEARAVVGRYGKESPEAREAYDGLKDHPWGQHLLRVSTGMKEST